MSRSRFRAVGALAGAAVIAVAVVAGSATAAVASAAAAGQAAVTGDVNSGSGQGAVPGGNALPFGSVAGGFVPLPGGQVARVSVGAGKTVAVAVAGDAGVPAGDADAVALAVAVTASSAAGAVTVFRAGAGRPGAPTLTWTAGRGASGPAVTGLSAAGKVSVANTGRRAVIVTIDATGYWLAGAPAAAGAFGPLPGGQVARVSVGAGKTVTITAADHGSIPNGAGAVSLAVAVATPAVAGSLVVYPAGTTRPAVASLSWAAGQPTAGLATVALPATGRLSVANTAKRAVTVTLDATGYWLSGTPAAAGAFGALADGAVARVSVGAGKIVTVAAAGHGGIPPVGVGAAALAVAVAGAPAAGALTLYPGGGARPGAPTLTWAARQAVTGLALVKLSGAGTVTVANTGRRAVTVTISGVGYWLAKARTVTAITPKPTTTTVGAGAVAEVTGSQDGTQTATLASGAAVPPAGGVLVAGTSTAAPDGLLGTVSAVAAGADGTHVVTLSPASLSQAYSTFDVSTSQRLTSAEVTESPAARPVPGGDAAEPGRASASGGSGFGYDLSKTEFDCSGSGAGPTIALTADLSKINIDLTLDANPDAPSIHFLVTADPVFDINLGFTGQITCKLENELLTAHIPIPGAPGLEVDLTPVVELTAGGQVSLDFNWSPRAALGFDKGPGISTESYGFGSSDGVTVSATAGGDVFLGLDAEISLAGRIGVGGDFGPDLAATYDPATGCVEVDGELKADLTADADVFVKDWTFALATGIFAKTELYHKCIPVPSPAMYAWGEAGLLSFGADPWGDPVKVPGSDAAFAFGWGFAYALEKDGTVDTFNPSTFKRTPVAGLAGITALAVNGDDTVYALRDDGRVLAWNPPQIVNGKPENGNADGTLGDGATKDSAAPVLVRGITTATAISAGYDTGYALLGNGTVTAWGGNEVDQLGDGGDEPYVTSPQIIPGLSGVRQVAGAWQGAFAVLDNGTVMKWGCDAAAASVSPSGVHTIQTTPAPVPGVTKAIAVAGGDAAGYALTASGVVWSWGDGALGKADNSGKWYNPAPIAGLPPTTAIASSQYQAGYALAGNGLLYTWGDLAESSNDEHETPVKVPGLSHVLTFGAGALAAWAEP
jgi:hypothetical protein